MSLFPKIYENGRNGTICRPWVHFHCDIPSDPFLFMQNHNKTYGMSGAIPAFHRKRGAVSLNFFRIHIHGRFTRLHDLIV